MYAEVTDTYDRHKSKIFYFYMSFLGARTLKIVLVCWALYLFGAYAPPDKK